MLTVLLQRGSGNWLPMLLPIIAIVALAKGTQMLVQYVKARRERRKQMATNYYDGIMDELITHEGK
jgi:hypothetical protein